MQRMDELGVMMGTYRGGAFHGSFDGGKSSGAIQLTSQTLIFEASGGTRVDFPFNGLRLELGGASNRMVFFEHPSRPGWSVYTSDRSILRSPELAEFPDLADDIARIRGRSRRGRVVAVLVLLLLLAGIYGLYLLKDPAVRQIVSAIPVDWEEQIGEVAFRSIETSSAFVEDPALLEQLETLVRPLISAIDDSRYEFKFHIVHDGTLNAFALPGGHVTLHTGLLLRAKRPEEVLGVLAHEIAHVTQRHSLQNMVSSAGAIILVQALVGDVGGLLAVLTENGSFLLRQKFSRDYESDADDIGWKYLVAANIDPRGMIEFFKKIGAESEENAGGMEEVLSFLNTHPATSERIAALEAKWEAMEHKDGFSESPIDFRKFQRAIVHLAGGNSDDGDESK